VDRHPRHEAGRRPQDARTTKRSLAPVPLDEVRDEDDSPCVRARVSCRGYCDLGCFFMSVVHKVQWEVERWSGTPELTGRYETAYGLTAAVRIAKGLGQGDIGSPVRSKILIAIIAKTVSRLCEGAKITGSDKRASMLFFADDGLILADDVQTLRRAFEAMWIVARVAGLRLQVKGKKKTAWSATYWESDGTERDVTGWEMVMPDGSTIPQLEGDDKYKYLGRCGTNRKRQRGGAQGKGLYNGSDGGTRSAPRGCDHGSVLETTGGGGDSDRRRRWSTSTCGTRGR
jgi:hypothetical protein